MISDDWISDDASAMTGSDSVSDDQCVTMMANVSPTLLWGRSAGLAIFDLVITSVGLHLWDCSGVG
jgi:hypothetical protein